MNQKTRHQSLLLAISIGYLLAFFRSFYWQIIRYSALKPQSQRQSYQIKKIDQTLGQIYSQDNYPITTSHTNYNLSLYKPELKDTVENIISAISSLEPQFKINDEVKIKLFLQPTIKWVDFNQNFSQKQSQQIQLPGLIWKKSETMSISQPDLFAPPAIAIQKYYYRQLAGQAGYLISPVDATDHIILTNKIWERPAQNGLNIITSLKPNIQKIITSELINGINTFQANSGSVTVLNPKTGYIIGIFSFVASPSATNLNSNLKPVTDLIEPGSIFKPVVLSIALDSHKISQDYLCLQCHQPLKIGTNLITNWNEQTHPNSNLFEIIKNSDNIGMSHIILQTGLPTFLSYFHQIGLDQKSHVDLFGESTPIKKSYWSEIDLAAASFGQGFAINQIQMISAFNIVANDGRFTKIKIVPEANDYSDNVTSKTIFQKSTTDFIKSVLKYATENGATSIYKPSDMEVCAKSGTAQIAVKGSYAKDEVNASYIGFSPCSRPKFIMAITLNNPKISSWGSSSAAPIWYKIAAKISPLL